MDAQDPVLCLLVKDDCSKWHPLEQLVNLLENRAWVFNVLIKTLSTFLTETEVLVDMTVFMVTAQKEDLTRILEFEGEEEADDFETLSATVNVISEEHVVKATNITCLLWCAPDIEESHQISVISVDIAENFDRRLQIFYEHGLSLEHLHNFLNEFKNLLFLDMEWPHGRHSLLTLPRRKQIFDKERIKRLVVVLLDKGRLHIRSKLAWLFLELVNRNLTYHE